MEATQPFCRVETDHKYRLYVPITRPLIKIATDLFPSWPLTSGEMYHAMVVFDESITRENSYGKQLYEEARLNLSDQSYAESEEGRSERAVLCVGKAGRFAGEDGPVPVRMKSLAWKKYIELPYVEVLLHCCDYSDSFHRVMLPEDVIGIFERSEI